MNIRDYLKKIQNLPLKQRKQILWTIVSIFIILFLFLFLQDSREKWKRIELPHFPSLKEEFQQIPEEKTEILEGLGGESLEGESLEEENSSSFEMTPEMKEGLEKFLEEALKALRESK